MLFLKATGLSCFGIQYTTLQPNHQNSYLRRRNSRDTGGLSEGGGADFVELLAGFGSEAVDGIIVECKRYLLVLQCLELFHFKLLAVNVAGVFDADFDLLDDFFAQGGVAGGEVAVGDFRAAEHLDEGFLADAGGFEALDLRFDGLLLATNFR